MHNLKGVRLSIIVYKIVNCSVMVSHAIRKTDVPSTQVKGISSKVTPLLEPGYNCHRINCAGAGIVQAAFD